MVCSRFSRHSSLPAVQESASPPVPDRELAVVHLEEVLGQAGLSAEEVVAAVEIYSGPEENLDRVGARSTPEAVRKGAQNCLVVARSLDRTDREEVVDRKGHKRGEDSSEEGKGTRRGLKEDLVQAVLDPDERSSRE